MDHPKSIKRHLLRPIVSRRASITYGVVKESTNILQSLIGGSSHYIRNSQHFVEQIKSIQLQQEECISCNVKALFTSVPVDPALNTIHGRLQQNIQLSSRTSLSIHNISTLLELCLKSTLFMFQAEYYEQVHDVAMGSTISPLVATLFVEDFEARTISATSNPPIIWVRYMNDAFIIQKAEHTQQLLTHLISLHPHIQLTMEAPNIQGAIPFLDTLVSLAPNGSLITLVQRKPTTHRPISAHGQPPQQP